MNNADMPAMPAEIMVQKTDTMWFGDKFPGLTKREHFAAMAMQGFISAGWAGMPPVDILAGYAVEQADALLAALEENKS
jgi:hypothetical protein